VALQVVSPFPPDQQVAVSHAFSRGGATLRVVHQKVLAPVAVDLVLAGQIVGDEVLSLAASDGVFVPPTIEVVRSRVAVEPLSSPLRPSMLSPTSLPLRVSGLLVPTHSSAPATQFTTAANATPAARRTTNAPDANSKTVFRIPNHRPSKGRRKEAVEPAPLPVFAS
jgi:hypothetical protein